MSAPGAAIDHPSFGSAKENSLISIFSKTHGACAKAIATEQPSTHKRPLAAHWRHSGGMNE
jgi:hypothetical protein